MPIGRIKTYIVSCTKCDWSESLPVRESIPSLFGGNKKHLPNVCPKCGSKTKNKKSPVDLWKS